ncbi:MAG: class I SAM-dependent methyltransferase [Theionarchaea archaeon]|nr:class I SAM-dependent methyltransferase [Theionarchaea archaeon]
MNPFILSHPLVRPLYGFLKECNESPLEKVVLDCGAGGNYPPLALFHQNGYKTYGIDTSDGEIKLAQKFCRENNIKLTIMKGDIRDIPFGDESMSFVYSINTVCHLSKKDTATALKEMERVLNPKGLLFVNFTSVDDLYFGRGQKVGKGEFIQEYDWYLDIVKEGHVCSYYEDAEPDKYFGHFKIIRKEKRIAELQIERDHHAGGGWQTADICYTAQKVNG